MVTNIKLKTIRLTQLAIMLSFILSACSTTSSKFQESQLDKHFNELEGIMATDIESRNLIRARDLIQQLKYAVTDDQTRQKELAITEQFVNESLAYQSNIKLLETTTKTLKSQISQQKKPLTKSVKQ